MIASVPSILRPTGSLVLALALTTALRPAAAQDSADAIPPVAFGSRERSESALIGIFYDLKQDQRGETKRVNYFDVVAEFLNSDWDEGVLNDFYRVSRPLFATSVFIPYIKAEAAPTAFGAEKTVDPGQWLIHYKGQVVAPRAGTFRFVGMADDLLAVAVDESTVLVAGLFRLRFPKKWYPSTTDPDLKAPCGPMVGGDWFTVKAGEIVDLDILIGERPGGGFGAWLEIEEKGIYYQPDEKGRKAYPIFQVSRVPGLFEGRAPAHLVNESIWPGVK